MASVKDIKNKLYSILSNNISDVKDWQEVIPPKGRFKSYPVGCVNWKGSSIENTMGSSKIIRDNFEIIVVSKYPVESEAQDKVLDLYEDIQDLIDSNSSLDSLVSYCYVKEVRKSSELVEGDYSIITLSIVIETYRKEV